VVERGERALTSLWRNRDFLKLWIGQAISQTGSRISREGLPLTAVLVLGAAPIQMGYLSGAGAAGILLFGLFAGAWSDRMRRRPVMVGADIGRALLLASVPIAALAGRLTMSHLYAVTAITGILTVWFDISYQAYLPALVDRENLVEGNSKLAMSEATAEVIGPGMTGVLVQILTAPIAIAFDAASFVISALSLTTIRKHEAAPVRPAGENITAEIVAGLRFSWNSPLLRPLLLRTATASFFVGFIASLYMVFAIRELKLTPGLLGMVISIGGFSSLFGAWINERLVRTLGFGRTLILAVAATGMPALLPAVAHGSVAVCAAFLAAGQTLDMTWTISNINEVSLRQAVAPAAVLGRVNSAMLMLFRGLLPVGALAGGVLAQHAGMRTALLAGALGVPLSVLWVVFSPIRKIRTLAHNEWTERNWKSGQAPSGRNGI
jgi:MFS family permease